MNASRSSTERRRNAAPPSSFARASSTATASLHSRPIRVVVLEATGGVRLDELGRPLDRGGIEDLGERDERPDRLIESRFLAATLGAVVVDGVDGDATDTDPGGCESGNGVSTR
ncbi:hypothetical protein [Halopelagius fulvigenes]|uniref:Uncharacterized protein n=1 Tax=Halopelagius fulvigenes TaxID=1198324 RepID=A0ABD5TYR8_9EURY